jgi:pyridoxal phosphate enzyme (YggS family)
MPESSLARLEINFRDIQRRIEAAAKASGRDAKAIKICAVTKGLPPARVAEILALGLSDHGENRPERLPDLALHFPAERRPRWHLIGHIQSRKLRAALPLVTSIHSVHSLELLELIESRAAELGREIPCLIQVNVSGEATKQGVSATELPLVLERAQSCRYACVQGLMTMAPASSDPSLPARVFATTRELRDRMASSAMPLPELSMGMSSDFEAAVREGATSVRIGSALIQDVWGPASSG